MSENKAAEAMEAAAVNFFQSARGRLCCYLALGAFLAAFVLGCTSSAAPKHQLHRQAATRQPLLLYQKTPCYGPCPAYDAHIFTDGTVLLKAWAHVPFTDTLKVQLTKRELARLKRDILHLPYHNLKPAYLSPRTDQSSSVFTFYEEGREVKSVRHQEGGPETLVRFQKKTEALLMGVIGRSTAAME